jgi:hypothetical protein
MRLITHLFFKLGDYLDVVLIGGGIALLFFWAATLVFFR